MLGVNAHDNGVPILASLSIGNLSNMGTVIGEFWNPKSVIIAADNDGDLANFNAGRYEDWAKTCKIMESRPVLFCQRIKWTLMTYFVNKKSKF